MQSHASTSTLLLMNGSDHLMPQTGLPAALEAANQRLRDQHLPLRIGTLPEYIASLKESATGLQTHSGELRSSYSAHLLPGVFSPVCGSSSATRPAKRCLPGGPSRRRSGPGCWANPTRIPSSTLPGNSSCRIIRTTASAAAVLTRCIAEMMPRFAQSEQIAGELVERALRSLAATVRVPASGDAYLPVVVFNASTGPRTEVVRCTAPIGFSRFAVVNERGSTVPTQVQARRGSELLNQIADKALVLSMLGIITAGRVLGYTILDAHLGHVEADGTVQVEVDVAEKGAPNLPAVEHLLDEVHALAEDESVRTFHIIAREAPITEFLFLAEGVPAFGGLAFTLQPQEPTPDSGDPVTSFSGRFTWYTAREWAYLAGELVPSDRYRPRHW